MDREKVNKIVEIDPEDERYIFIDGKQYVSLSRFLESKRELLEDYDKTLNELNDLNYRLHKENEALRTILKDAFREE